MSAYAPQVTTRIPQRYLLNAADLKWIAIITMVIDHVGAIIVPITENAALYTAHRSIGRIAFPIFAFLLVEGFRHTRNRYKYCRNMAIFACVSEIPFDIASNRTFFDPSSQNIFVTLTLGIVMLHCLERVHYDDVTLTWGIRICIVGVFCTINTLIAGDYLYWGIIAIFLISLAHTPLMRVINGSLGMTFQAASPIVFIGPMLTGLYNGKRGKQNKWFFYTFYPAHLCVLIGIQYILLATI